MAIKIGARYNGRMRHGRLLALILGLLIAASASAQGPGWPTIDQKTMDQGAGMLRQAWKQVQEKGPAAAEQVIRQAPQQFKEIRVQTDRAVAQVNRWAKEKRLDERKNLALELWRIRGSLDLMALLESDILHEITGIDHKTLKNLRVQIEKAQAMLRMR